MHMNRSGSRCPAGISITSTVSPQLVQISGVQATCYPARSLFAPLPRSGASLSARPFR